MLTSTAPNGTPATPAPAREFICVPIDDKWEPRVGDELRHRELDYKRTITNVVADYGFTYTAGGADFTHYAPYLRLANSFECFRPVALAPTTITMPFEESTINEIRRAKNLNPIGPAGQHFQPMPAVPSTAEMSVAIDFECGAIAAMLQSKNLAYGNSIADPIKVFSKADADERINVRIDDKISRLVHGKPDDNEDAELDLIGYLILRRAKRRVQGCSK